jgi:enterobactin synthetase component D
MNEALMQAPGVLWNKRLMLTRANGVPACPVYLVRYMLDGFRLEWFSDEAIDCPPTVRSSVRKRQAEYFYGRLCARQALGALGLGIETVGSGTSRQPLWPPGILGSISHNAEFAAAVVLRPGPETGIGIDLEQVIGEQSADALLETTLSVPERAYLQRDGWPVSLLTLLTIVFSAKESFFKAAFPTVGRYFDFDAISVEKIDLQANTVSFVVNQCLSPQLSPGLSCQTSYRFTAPKTVLSWCLL